MLKKTALFLSILSAASGAANAQQVTSVFERSRTDYDALGVRAGSFEVKPTLNVQGVYDSNIFLTQNNEEEDFITKIKPGVSVASDWSNHSLVFNASGDFGLYSDNTTENYEDFGVSVNGRLDVLRDTYIFAGLKHDELTQSRGSADAAANAAEPTEYTITGGNIGASRKVSRISVSLDNVFEVYDFDDDFTSAGVEIDNDDRDREEFRSNLRLSYELNPTYQVFVDGTYITNSYDLAASAGRDSDGYEVAVGATVDITGKTNAEAYVGYFERDYDGANFATVDGPTFGANLLWNPTQLTSVNAGINRSIEETTINGASGYIATAYSAGVEHELMRNVLVGGDLSFTTNEYEGAATGPEREDDITQAGLKAKYLLNRNVAIGANYSFSQRESNVANQDYEDNQVTLGLQLAL